jgi:hypothetical protein
VQSASSKTWSKEDGSILMPQRVGSGANHRFPAEGKAMDLENILRDPGF